CIGSLLFLLYINDLPDIIAPPCSVVLFADDTKLYASSLLQTDLINSSHALMDWCSTGKLQLALAKCAILHFETNKTRDKVSTCLGIQQVEYFRDLGVYVDKDLKFSYHCSVRAK